MDGWFCTKQEPQAERHTSAIDCIHQRTARSRERAQKSHAFLLTLTYMDGWCGRTSPVSCRLMEDGRLEPSSGCWSNAGMGSPGESWTLRTLEYPSDGVASSLSDILEDGDLPQRYYLTGRACRGILRRAQKRGKTLPLPLARALKAVAASEQTSILTADSLPAREPPRTV